ncbi:MAG TPA: ABC transporter permease [Bacteroidales bacterium]|nr:ABC transporter permease [Bacteroidales bacterium]
MNNVFKPVCRNFLRKPVINLINILGLAVSLALVIVLSLYSYSELTTDSHHKNWSRVYLLSDLEHGGIYSPAILKNQVDLNVPEVESAVRIAPLRADVVFQAGDRDPIVSDMITADPDLFKLFTYEPIEGNLNTALNDPMTIVLTRPLAAKLFGNEPALGKTVRINNKDELTVSAVVDEPKGNSLLSFSSVTSNASRKIISSSGAEFEEWGYWNFHLFVLLKQGANIDAATLRIRHLFPNYAEQKLRYDFLKLNSLNQVYFSKVYAPGGLCFQLSDKKKIMILVLVAALVLIIALVNFLNISSSQWIEKIKRTGVLKVIGAGKMSILKSVLSEAFILFLISLFLAILIVQFSFPFISRYTGIHFNPNLIYKPSFLMVYVGSVFLLSLIFSFIPALRISRSKAVDNLKNATSKDRSFSVSRGILVTAQFAIAIVLIAFTIVVQKQVDFGSSNLGFNQDHIIGIKLTPQLSEKKDVIKNFVQRNPAIKGISFTQYFPGKLNEHWATTVEIEGEKQQLGFDTFNGDAELCRMLGLQLVQGRFFSEDLVSDARKMIVNETFVREHKLKNPVGMKFVMGSGDNPPTSEIIGVVKDFHYKPVSIPIGSLLIRNDWYVSYCLVNINSTDFKSLNRCIQGIRSEMNNLSPSFPVEISFMDQAVENMYQSEIRFRRTFSLFAGCAIVICCLGILAMSLFTCQRRIKEIGIRRVNGARVGEVMALLNRDFVRWVIIAFFIATPIAWFIMNKWLENFAYKTPLNWWIFALSGGSALAIALLTVSWQSWRAARRNPVESLRYE